MSTNRKIRRAMGGIQTNENLMVKAKMVNLGVALFGCPLFVAVPEKPGMDAKDIAQRIKKTIYDLQERACEVTMRDVYEICIDMQKRDN